MKAKDYYKLIKQAKPSELPEAVGEIVDGMNREVKELINKRHVKTDERVRAIILELNNKWNAIVSMFEKDYGYPLLERNKFKNLWGKYYPHLKL